MSSANNVIHLAAIKKANRQELIDDIGARAFLFLRDEAEAHKLPIKEVIAEHILGMAMVISSVEGEPEAQRILDKISLALSPANNS